jgi:hypothetical protein
MNELCEQMQEDIRAILDGRSNPETIDLICDLLVEKLGGNDV